jgi:putative peptidoglycan lipid II flippase
LFWAAWRVDWIALQAHGLQRAAAVALVLGGVAAAYFAVLAVCGLRPRDVMRRA